MYHLSYYTSSLVQVRQEKSLGRSKAFFDDRRAAYFEIILRLSAAIIIFPSASVTSPVTSTVWATWAMILAFFSAASPPVSTYTLPSDVRSAMGRPALAHPIAQSVVSPFGIL